MVYGDIGSASFALLQTMTCLLDDSTNVDRQLGDTIENEPSKLNLFLLPERAFKVRLDGLVQRSSTLRHTRYHIIQLTTNMLTGILRLFASIGVAVAFTYTVWTMPMMLLLTEAHTDIITRSLWVSMRQQETKELVSTHPLSCLLVRQPTSTTKSYS